MDGDARGFAPDLWREMGCLGWVGVALPPTVGGSGRSVLEAALLLEEMGRVLLPSPFVATVMVAAPLLLALGSAEQHARWLRPLAAGDLVATLALVEPGWRDEREPVAVEARRDGSSVLVTGVKRFVPFAAHADLVLVVARLEGEPSLLALEAGTAGVEHARLPTLGGDPAYETRLAAVRVPASALVGRPGDAAAALDRALDLGAVASLAYMVGAAERVLELTVGHARTREQFGRPIGSFQAVAHRCVDMRSDVDALRWLVYQAAWTLATDRPAALAVGAAKAWGNEALRRVFMHAHQVHGALGFSTEHDLHLFTRRAKATELQWGSAQVHRERVARAMGL
jgi:alkylation response protein AidB-like acyl-CoA dehydrogenase